VLTVVLAITASTAIGVGAERRFGAGAFRACRLLIDLTVWLVLPFVVFFIAGDLDLGGGVGIGLLAGYVVVAIVGLCAHQAGTRLLRLSRPQVGALICGVILANTGYLGIPLNGALLGHSALGPAIAWDTVVSQVALYGAAFAVGAAFGERAGESRAERIKAFLTRNPVLYALIAGLLAPESITPHALVEIARTLAYMLLPVGFFILGVNLMGGEERGAWRLPPPLSREVALAGSLRMVMAPALVAALAVPLGGVPDAYILQAAMPTGINSLIVAHLYGLDVRLTASIVAWTTLASIVTAPLLAAVL
jgi:hypothetical protein